MTVGSVKVKRRGSIWSVEFVVEKIGEANATRFVGKDALS